MAGQSHTKTKKSGPRKAGVYVVYRGVPLANTEISRAARTRALYQAMKREQDAASV